MTLKGGGSRAEQPGAPPARAVLAPGTLYYLFLSMDGRPKSGSRWQLRRRAHNHAPSGRSSPLVSPDKHVVSGARIKPPFPDGSERAFFAMGCFWGAERLYWELAGVISTAVGYQGGTTPNPTYREVCTGRTGHAETVQVVFDPATIDYSSLLVRFWEGHDPTQGMRQGADVGTQYRSAIFAADDRQMEVALSSRDRFQVALSRSGLGAITTDIARAPEFYYAEEAHQQYLAKNPQGYCGLGGTGVACPVGPTTARDE